MDPVVPVDLPAAGIFVSFDHMYSQYIHRSFGMRSGLLRFLPIFVVISLIGLVRLLISTRMPIPLQEFALHKSTCNLYNMACSWDRLVIFLCSIIYHDQRSIPPDPLQLFSYVLSYFGFDWKRSFQAFHPIYHYNYKFCSVENVQELLHYWKEMAWSYTSGMWKDWFACGPTCESMEILPINNLSTTNMKGYSEKDVLIRDMWHLH